MFDTSVSDNQKKKILNESQNKIELLGEESHNRACDSHDTTENFFSIDTSHINSELFLSSHRINFVCDFFAAEDVISFIADVFPKVLNCFLPIKLRLVPVLAFQHRKRSNGRQQINQRLLAAFVHLL